jgi:hypothetical protein
MTSTISRARWARTQTAAARDLTFWRATREFRAPLPSYLPTARQLAARALAGQR